MVGFCCYLTDREPTVVSPHSDVRLDPPKIAPCGPATLRVAISCSRMSFMSPISGEVRLYRDAATACCV